MDSIQKLLQFKQIKKTNTNKVWLLSEDIAKLTNTTPNRWLRQVKNNFGLMERKLSEFKETLEIAKSRQQLIKCKASLFTWTLKQ